MSFDNHLSRNVGRTATVVVVGSLMVALALITGARLDDDSAITTKS